VHLTQDLEKEISNFLQKEKRLPYLCSPLQKEVESFKTRKEKTLKFFFSNLESKKNFLPLHSQSQTGLANGKKTSH